MNRSDALKLSKQALGELQEQLAAGKGDNLMSFIKAVATFHDYSYRNIMMIVSQRPDATHVAGVRAWNKLNRYVRKGEKGIAIFAPMVFKGKDSERAGDDAEDTRLNFRVVHVFDVTQTEGEPLPEVNQVQGDPTDHLERLKNAAIDHGIILEYHDHLGSAFGKSYGGTIKLERDMPPAQEFSVLAHELAHELLHQGKNRTDASKDQKELEAEAVAFVLCKYAGLESGSAHCEYIQLYSGDLAVFTSSLEAIQQTACRMIEAMADNRIDPTP